MNKFKRRIAAGAVTLAATGAAIVGTVAAAPTASAEVATGNYTFTTYTFGIPSSAPARVQGNVLTLFSPVGPVHYRITNYPGGGYIDSGQGQRYFLGGDSFFGPFVVGNNTLTRR
ncbi:MAG: hypothetical protein DI630_00210 [Gordonia sp. (in: high G+C Gram-positive bacteria)]|nr:MAG: hypothetical protein DI630_00210 [Gordonia sp. (in: high G+C Gram-positive bacteria)]